MENNLIANALKNVAEKASISHDNGTYGESYKCYLYDAEAFLTKEQREKDSEIAFAKLLGANIEKLQKLRQERDTLPNEGGNLIFKVVGEPLEVKSTYLISTFSGGVRKSANFSVQSDEIKVPIDIANSDLITQTELDEEYKDANGEPVKAIMLHLDKCMLDAFGDEYNKDGTIWRPKHIKVCIISRRAMQIDYKANSYIMNNAKRFKGSLSDAQFKDMFGDINPFTTK